MDGACTYRIELVKLVAEFLIGGAHVEGNISGEMVREKEQVNVEPSVEELLVQRNVWEEPRVCVKAGGQVIANCFPKSTPTFRSGQRVTTERSAELCHDGPDPDFHRCACEPTVFETFPTGAKAHDGATS